MSNPPPAILTRALQLHRAGQLAAAAALYREIIEAEPHHANALHLLGLIARQEGDHTAAVGFFSRAITADPAVAPFRLNRGLAFRALSCAAEALEDFRQARLLEPGLAEAHHQEGNVLKQLGRFSEAITAFRQAVQLSPTLTPAWLNLGVACLESDNPVAAIPAFQHAVSLEPARAEAHNILGVALLATGQVSPARAAFNEALRLDPLHAPAHDNLGRLSKSEGLLDEAVRHFRAALKARPDPRSHSNLLLALNYHPALAPEGLLAEHRAWHQLHAAPLAPTTPPTLAPIADRRLRVGYVSPDFAHHAVAYFIAPVLASHDRTKIEVFCYASVAAPDRFTERLRGLAEHWRDIARLDDGAAAALVRADGIDLLIDLAGHTAGNRLLLFARRPAPVQATWIGYPNTTGLDAIDYRLTDAISDPLRIADPSYSEQLLRLPSTFSCYEPDATAPAVGPLPSIAPGIATFGCFNNFAKVTPEVIALWSRLLRELPTARLLLKSRGLGDPAVIERVRNSFAAAGVNPEQVRLNGEELSVAEHLALYHEVDIALDPFPYNGTTTTCEALWMGVPVITLAGSTHAGRVGASLLTHTGLAGWIATTPDEYVVIAMAASQDPKGLAELRRGLREKVRHSPLCDAATFTRGLEGAYATMVGARKADPEISHPDENANHAVFL